MGNAATSPKARKRTLEMVERIQKELEELSWIQCVYLIGLALATGAIVPLAVDKGNPIGGGLMITATLLLSQHWRMKSTLGSSQGWTAGY